MKYLKKSSNILIYGVGILVFIIVVYIVNKFLSKESFTKYGNIMNEGFQSNKISGDGSS